MTKCYSKTLFLTFFEHVFKLPTLLFLEPIPRQVFDCLKSRE